MCARAGEVQPRHRSAIFAEARSGAQRKHLVNRHFQVHHIAAVQAKLALQIERRLNQPAADFVTRHVGRVALQHGQDAFGFTLCNHIPVFAIGKLIGKVLAPQKQNMLAGRRQCAIRRRPCHSNHCWLRGRPARQKIAVGPVQIIKIRADELHGDVLGCGIETGRTVTGGGRLGTVVRKFINRAAHHHAKPVANARLLDGSARLGRRVITQ